MDKKKKTKKRKGKVSGVYVIPETYVDRVGDTFPAQTLERITTMAPGLEGYYMYNTQKEGCYIDIKTILKILASPNSWLK